MCEKLKNFKKAKIMSLMFLRGRHSRGDDGVAEPAANQQAAHGGHHRYGRSVAADRLRGSQRHHVQLSRTSKELVILCYIIVFTSSLIFQFFRFLFQFSLRSDEVVLVLVLVF